MPNRDSAESEGLQSDHEYRLVDATRSWVETEAAAVFRDLLGIPVVSVWAQPSLSIDQLLPIGRNPVWELVRRNAEECAHCSGVCRSWLAELEGTGSSGITFTCPRGIANIWSARRSSSGLIGLLGVQFRAGGAPTPLFDGSGGIRREEFFQAWSKLPSLGDRQQRGVVAFLEMIGRSAVEHGRLAPTGEVVSEVGKRVRASGMWTSWRCQRDGGNGGACTAAEDPTDDVVGDEGAAARRRRIARVLAWVDIEYPTSVALRHYADRLGVSIQHLSSIFSEIVGAPFRTYLRELRVRKAQAILRAKREMSVAAVGYSVGYEDPNSFRRAFRLQTGVSPSQWRAATE